MIPVRNPPARLQDIVGMYQLMPTCCGDQPSGYEKGFAGYAVRPYREPSARVFAGLLPLR
jgi:hypothetical protein